MFWEEFKKKVTDNTTGSDIADQLLGKLSSSMVNPLVLLKPSYYLGNLAVLTMDYIGYVGQLLKVMDGDKPALLEKVIMLRECGKTVGSSLKEILEPLEIAIQQIEEAYEGNEEETLEDIEDAELGDTDEEAIAAKIKEEEEEEEDDEEREEEDYRDDFSEQKDALEQELEVKLRTSDCSEMTVKNLAQRISEIYLEGVMLNRDLIKISEVAEGDLIEMLSILVDIQYSLDEKLRALLLEDYLMTEDPLFVPGLPTTCALFMNEITEKMLEND